MSLIGTIIFSEIHFVLCSYPNLGATCEQIETFGKEDVCSAAQRAQGCSCKYNERLYLSYCSCRKYIMLVFCVKNISWFVSK